MPDLSDLSAFYTMTRDVARLAGNTFDVLVIGGGIHGLMAAYDAAQRGLSVALLERGDFGAESSFNHLRTAHGGLRSLQSLDVRRARESIRERRAYARIAPHFVVQQPFLIAVRSSLTRGKLAMRAAFKVDRYLGRDRNEQVETALHLPAGQVVSKAVIERLFPGVRRDGLAGGAMWYDYRFDKAERLILAVARGAAEHGAALANYAEAVEPIRAGTGIAGMRARDLLTGEGFDVRAALTINAAGAWVGSFMQAFGVSREVPLLKAMNLVTTLHAGDVAVGAPTADGRLLFKVPWRGRAVIGTSQSDRFVAPNETNVTAAELTGFIDDINAAFPDLSLTRGQISLVHRGVVPAVRDSSGKPALKPHAEIVDHASNGVEGAISIIGVKYTTARAAAARAVDLALRKLRRRRKASRTASAPLPGAEIADFEALIREELRARRLRISDDTMKHLGLIYGSHAPLVVALIAENAAWGERIVPQEPVIAAEAIHAVRRDMAHTLTDVIVRRIGLGTAGYPGDDTARATARILAEELGWTESRIVEEIETLRRSYLPVGPLYAGGE